jgi:hypothetical protein
MTAEVNESLARRVLEVVDAGLVSGIGVPEPGKMCIEAAVCFAMGLPHSDEPTCVAPTLRHLKIRLNDARWSSDQARAKGLRRLAIAQLGSAGALDEKEFAKRCARLAIQTSIPTALRAVASIAKGGRKERLLAAADLCERDPTEANARSAKDAAAYAYAAYAAYAAAAADAAAAAYAAAYAATAAAYAAYAAYAAAAAAAYAAYAADADRSLAAFAEGIVQILIEMHAPGCQWLWMTEEAGTCST